MRVSDTLVKRLFEVGNQKRRKFHGTTTKDGTSECSSQSAVPYRLAMALSFFIIMYFIKKGKHFSELNMEFMLDKHEAF